MSGKSISWSSSKSNIASVDANGRVTAVQVGTTSISATVDGKTGSVAATVVVIPVASITMSPAPATLMVGQTLQLVATAKDSAGNPLSERVVVWSTSDSTKVRVSATGSVTGVAVGTATITASSEGKGGLATATVVPIPVASVAVSPATASVIVGQTLQLTATAKDSAGNTLSGRVVVWSSSDSSKARVSATGLATAVAAGTTAFTASSEGKSGDVSVTVGSDVVAFSYVLVPPATRTGYASSTRLRVKLLNAFGAALANLAVTWSMPSSTGWLFPVTAVTQADGTAEAAWVADTLPGLAAVSVQVNGKTQSSGVNVAPMT